jgi:uncharacterized protein
MATRSTSSSTSPSDVERPADSLFVEGRCVLAPPATVIVANTARQRRRGLLGRTEFAGAMWFPNVKSVHTIRMKFSIDVAHIDGAGRVIRVQMMPPWRLGRFVPAAHAVLEAQAGSFGRWGVHVGSNVMVGKAGPQSSEPVHP